MRFFRRATLAAVLLLLCGLLAPIAPEKPDDAPPILQIETQSTLIPMPSDRATQGELIRTYENGKEVWFVVEK